MKLGAPLLVLALLAPGRAFACDVEPGPAPRTTSVDVLAPGVVVGYAFADASGFFAGGRVTVLHQAEKLAVGARAEVTSVAVAQREERSWWASGAIVARPSAVDDRYTGRNVCSSFPAHFSSSPWPLASLGASLRGSVERIPTTPTVFAAVEEAAVLFIGLRVDFPLVAGGHGTTFTIFGGLEAPFVVRHTDVSR